MSLSKQAILRIENGDRGISLDEALAIALALNAVPAYLLTPPGDALVALSDDGATDGSGVREWLRYGLWSSVERRDPPDFARDDVQRERFQLDLAALALALVDAKRGNDQAGVDDAFKAIVDTVKRRIAEKGANDA